MASPLTAEHKRAIDKALADIKEAKDQIARAKLAKIDVSDQEAQVSQLEEQLRAIKAAYFPQG
jgi:bacterioferritin (cytochrome b1)